MNCIAQVLFGSISQLLLIDHSTNLPAARSFAFHSISLNSFWWSLFVNIFYFSAPCCTICLCPCSELEIIFLNQQNRVNIQKFEKKYCYIIFSFLIKFYFAPLTNVGPSDGYIRSLWDLYRYVESSFHWYRNQHTRGHWMPQMQYQSKSRYVPYFWTFNSQYLKRNPDWLFKYNKVETLEIAQRITIKVKSLKREFSNFDINLWSLIKRRHFCI